MEAVLNSIKGIKQAEPSPFLFGKLMYRIAQQVPSINYYPTRILVRYALALLLLAGINIGSVIAVKQYKTPVAEEQTGINHLAKEYFNTNQDILWY